MKPVPLMIVFLPLLIFCLQDQFRELDNSKEIQALEQAITDFGIKKKSILETIKDWQKGASESKQQEVEKSIADLFKKKGELSSSVISYEQKRNNAARLDPDFQMSLTSGSLDDIQLGFSPLANFEAFYQNFTQHKDPTERALLFNADLNRNVYDLLKTFRQNELKFKNALLVFFQNVKTYKQQDFDLRQFFFKDQFEDEDRFVNSREGEDVNQLFLVYADQKRRFLEQQEFLLADFKKLTSFFGQFYRKIASLQQFYYKKRKEAAIMDFEDPKVSKDIEKLFELRGEIYEVVGLARTQITLIGRQRNVFLKIYGLARKIEDLRLAKQTLDAELDGTATAADILEAHADQDQAEADAAEAQRDQLEAQEDYADSQNLKRSLKLSKVLFKNEPSEGNSRKAQDQDIDAILKQKANARAERKRARDERQKMREQRAKERDHKARNEQLKREELQNSDGVSAEAYFRNKEYDDRLNMYSKGIEDRIDNNELRLSDLQSTKLSEQIVNRKMGTDEQNANSNIVVFAKPKKKGIFSS